MLSKIQKEHSTVVISYKWQLQQALTCHLSKILIQVDKEYNFMVNYAKGSGNKFFDWKTDIDPESNISLPFMLLVDIAKILLLRGHYQFTIGWMICWLVLTSVC